MQYRGKTLTEEQATNLSEIIEGSDYVIQAPPGSGKTFLLRATSRKLPGPGLNLTFNKLLAMQAKDKFPRHVDCRTGHSVAFAAEGWKFKDRLRKITGSTLSQNYDIGSTSLYRTASQKGYLILNTIRLYCYSSDKELNHTHLPHIPVFDPNRRSAIEADLLESTKPILNKMLSTKSTIPITHDIYLKKWALTNPVIKKRFVLFDEYQDANPVMASIIAQQACQKVFVGDMFQQIYSWRGAVNAITDTTLPTLYLTQSFRFGQPIADLANTLIASYYPVDFPYTSFSGNSAVESIISTTPIEVDCIICRTNNGVIKETISAHKSGLDVHINGGTNQLISLIQGIEELKMTNKSYHPELFLFNSFDELLEYANSPFGGDLKPTIKLLDQYGKRKLLALLHTTTSSPDEADIVITTAHKAKGLEWSSVRLGSDYPGPEDDQLPSTEETNILYVAMTRALEQLDISQCRAIHHSSLIEATRINREHKELMIN